jgi:hypothetical protein
VTYEPPADLAVTRDRFTYAAGSAVGVSAAADVVIQIVDDPPELIVPDIVEFPAVLAGETAAKELEIFNQGGGLVEGEVQVDAPWRVEGPAAYRLGAKERKIFTIVFAPIAPGSFRTEARYTSRRDRTTALRAECLAVVALEPATLELRHAPGDPVRRATLQLANRTDQERTLSITAGDRLKVPSSATLPARGKATIPVEMAANDTGALREELRLDGVGSPIRVPVMARPAGPIVRSATREIGFGKVAPGRSAQVALDLENIGGAEGFWKVEAPAPFVAEPAEVSLRPGEKKPVALTLRAPEPGRYRGWARVAGESQALEILVEAEVPTSVPAARQQSAAARPKIQRIAAAASRPATSAPAARAEEPEETRPLFSIHSGDVALRAAAQRHARLARLPVAGEGLQAPASSALP